MCTVSLICISTELANGGHNLLYASWAKVKNASYRVRGCCWYTNETITEYLTYAVAMGVVAAHLYDSHLLSHLNLKQRELVGRKEKKQLEETSSQASSRLEALLLTTKKRLV